MRSSLEQMERTAAYLSGRLSPDQRALFESEMAGDPVLREQVDFQRDMQRVVQRRVLRSEIGAAAKYAGGSSGFSWITAVVVTGIIAAAGVGSYFLFADKKPVQKPVGVIVASQDEQPSADDGAEAISESEDTPVVPAQFAPGAPGVNDIALWDGDLHDLPFIDPPYAGTSPEKMGSSPVHRVQTIKTVAFDDLDFTPKGFAAAVKAQVSGEKAAHLTHADIEELYYSYGFSEASPVKEDLYVTGKFRQKAASVSKRKKNKTYVSVTDGRGDKMKDVLIEYSFYGDAKTSKTDENGAFSFSLYGDIVTDVKLTIPGYGDVTVPNVPFTPKMETCLEVDLPERNPHVVAWSPEYSCGVNPLAVRAIRSEAFRTTFLMTEAFRERLQALQQLENGQELFELYVHNLLLNMTDVDQLVAGHLSGENKKRFEAFSAQNYGNVLTQESEKTQAEWDKLYETELTNATKNTKSSGNIPESKKTALTEYVYPCATK